ncbi:MAG: hypothetical protein ACUVQ1_08895 [Candidatus Kapaibacteriales bacterium]
MKTKIKTKRISNYVYRLIQSNPLFFILFLSLFVNTFAVIFSKGYAMHDDHFGPIEQPWQIINDSTIWEQRQNPHAHSIFYPLLHFILFKFLYSLNISDPQLIMLVVRFLHSFYHIIGLILLYKLLLTTFNEKIALSIITAYTLLWFIPSMNVRNLIEMVCIPPMTLGFFLLIKYRDINKKHLVILAGGAFALAFAFRYQTLIITATIFIYLISRKKINIAFHFIAGFLLFALLIQGSTDTFAWGYPFASFIEYLRYNLSHSYDYTTGPIYRYLLLLLGVFIPPVSFFILYYFVKGFKEYELIFLSVLAFFTLHSIFPNKQERFILPIVPFIFTFGSASFLSAISENKIWDGKKQIAKFLLFWFFTINTPLLILFTLNYNKKTRCESLYYLSKKEDVQAILYIFGKAGAFKPPEFYLNKYGTNIIQMHNLDSLDLTHYQPHPNYAIIFGGKETDLIIQQLELNTGKKVKLEKTFEPSLVDDILFRLNPKYNRNQTAKIYSITD